MTVIKNLIAVIVAFLIITVPVMGISAILLASMFHMAISQPVAYALVALALADMAVILAYAIVQSRRKSLYNISVRSVKL